LEAHPVQSSFRKLFGEWASMPKLNVSVSYDPFLALDFSVSKLAGLAKGAIGATLKRMTELESTTMDATELQVLAKRTEAFLMRAQRSEAEAKWEKAINFRHSAQTLLSQASSLIARLLEPSWRDMPRDNEKRQQWIEEARLYIAAQCVSFLLHVFFQLRNLISFVFIGLLLMLVAVSSYPFEPREWILWFNWVIILSAVFSTIIVFVQMNTDSILSHLSDTTPGRLSWTGEFTTKIVIYGAVPVLALLSAQFPESLRQMVSWFGSVQGNH